MRRQLEIFLKFTRTTGHPHPLLQGAIKNYEHLLKAMGRSPAEIKAQLNALGKPFGIQFGSNT